MWGLREGCNFEWEVWEVWDIGFEGIVERWGEGRG